MTQRIDHNRYGRKAEEQLSKISRAMVAKLVIFTRESDDVCGYLVDFAGNSPIVELRYSLGPVREIVHLVSLSRFAFGISQSQASRSPQRIRGAIRPVVTRKAEARASERAFRELGTRLFPSGLIARLPDQSNLLLLPTGILATLPFYALVPANSVVSLSEQVILSILPSLTDDNRLEVSGYRTWNGTSGNKVLVLGNPDLSRHSDWRFQPLPGAEAEARHVADSFFGWAFFGRDATADRFFMHAPEADLIYLATHAVSSETDALDGSFIALSDKLITPREIQASDFKARLAVLSACQTGLGEPHDGGTIGLARAFNLAGVPGVIMSLWNVDDDATKLLMESFLQHVKLKAPQEALTLAMRERRKADPNPAKWASFVYFGFPMVNNANNR